MEKTAFKKISDYIWEIPTSYRVGMKVPVWIFASSELLSRLEEHPIDQIINVTGLPGIVGRAVVLADAHSGYGFPIGGVAAFDTDSGIISPGGIGFDINCGIRLMMTDLEFSDIREKVAPLIDEFFRQVPSGLGRKGILKLNKIQLEQVIEGGAFWCVKNGYGDEKDLAAIEDGGKLAGADFRAVSEKAIGRGISQVGGLGSGNHFLEIEVVSEIFDSELAKKFGIFNKNQVGVAIHSGSRGFGHQIGTDYLRIFLSAMEKYKIEVSDRELACAPFKSSEGQRYFGAMKAAANVAYANRQIIGEKVRQVLRKMVSEKIKCELVADVCHNVAKLEKVVIDGQEKEVLIHRKGATRSYEGIPIVVGGSMEEGIYLLVGTRKAEEISLGSTAHGAGRAMSRSKARKKVWGENLAKDLKKKGIYIRTASFSGLAEEAGFAYKRVSEVVEAVVGAGLAKKVVKYRPVGNIKG